MERSEYWMLLMRMQVTQMLRVTCVTHYMSHSMNSYCAVQKVRHGIPQVQLCNSTLSIKLVLVTSCRFLIRYHGREEWAVTALFDLAELSVLGALRTLQDDIVHFRTCNGLYVCGIVQSS